MATEMVFKTKFGHLFDTVCKRVEDSLLEIATSAATAEGNNKESDKSDKSKNRQQESTSKGLQEKLLRLFDNNMQNSMRKKEKQTQKSSNEASNVNNPKPQKSRNYEVFALANKSTQSPGGKGNQSGYISGFKRKVSSLPDQFTKKPRLDILRSVPESSTLETSSDKSHLWSALLGEESEIDISHCSKMDERWSAKSELSTYNLNTIEDSRGQDFKDEQPIYVPTPKLKLKYAQNESNQIGNNVTDCTEGKLIYVPTPKYLLALMQHKKAVESKYTKKSIPLYEIELDIIRLVHDELLVARCKLMGDFSSESSSPLDIFQYHISFLEKRLDSLQNVCDIRNNDVYLGTSSALNRLINARKLLDQIY